MVDKDTTDPDFDRRQGDAWFHEQAPADSGSAGSFATRHNEFAPGDGHGGAAHDLQSGESVLGDGTPKEDLPAHWDKGDAEGVDPAAQDTEAGEAERPDTRAGDGQAREAHPGGEAQG